MREADVRAAVRQGRAVIYGVRIGKPAPPFLEDVVRTSGGRLLHPPSATDLSRTFAEILQEFRTRYFLRYTPSGVARRGWHRVNVRLKGVSGHLSYREGYEAR